LGPRKSLFLTGEIPSTVQESLPFLMEDFSLNQTVKNVYINLGLNGLLENNPAEAG
jgi:hypothetical protein